jgi:hypothetical protein
MAIKKDQILAIDIPNLSDVQRKMKGMESLAPEAIKNAINQTIKAVMGYMAEDAQKAYIVKKSAVKKTLNKVTAKQKSLAGWVISSSKEKVKLIGYQVRPPKPQPSDPPNFYSARLKRRGKFGDLSGNSGRSKGFVAKMKSGHVGVFERMLGISRKAGPRDKRKKDDKLAEMYGLAIPQMLSSEKAAKKILKKGADFMNKEIIKQIDKIMKGK